MVPPQPRVQALPVTGGPGTTRPLSGAAAEDPVADDAVPVDAVVVEPSGARPQLSQ
ncbi:hypothetical protein GCM10020229_58690 [Kitasatospora albolonga]